MGLLYSYGLCWGATDCTLRYGIIFGLGECCWETGVLGSSRPSFFTITELLWSASNEGGFCSTSLPWWSLSRPPAKPPLLGSDLCGCPTSLFTLMSCMYDDCG